MSYEETVPLARLEANLVRVRERITAAAEAAGRDPSRIQLLPVTKSQSIGTVRNLIELGETHFAENRADRLLEKAEALREFDPVWHFIGPLQRNKVRKVLRHAPVLHSVDSLPLLAAIERIAREEGLRVDVFLQIWLSGEAEKQGLRPSEAPAALGQCGGDSPLRAVGLMAMGPREDPGLIATAQVFGALRSLAEQLWVPLGHSSTCRLSMGMSSDLECAVAEGSTILRIGSDLFA